MKNVLTVKVVRCSNKDWWYSTLVGSQINVVQYDGMDYALYGNPTLLIYKSDVKVISSV